ncbi:AraC family transcriptional regulator [Marinobacter nanhaiticus D15-8W]|uniref:AraC family transcriptional regulator n=1 Tax=Marinobacter nanhaiticus D15-8W TaxID=626887 RepID=N6X7Y6_9GAMM|nr:AraC family transcriptional regulator [Marinobacter nanhaiticus]ENO17263.1 AraC family transcriptional regulator [Marinobacter nanhaiticus D15-8W]
MTETSNRRRQALGNISVLYLSVMARAVEQQGKRIKPLFEQFGITENLLSAPDARISIPRFMRLGRAAIGLTGNPNLGLVMGEQTRAIDAGLSGLAAMSAPTAGEGLATITTYSLLNSRNSRGHPHYEADRHRACFYSIRPYNIYNYFVVDSVMAGWTQFLRRVTGETNVLEQVNIEYPDQGQQSAFEAWFGCPVSFGAKENSIQLRPSIAATASNQHQPAMHRALTQQCDTQLKRIRGGWTVIDQVREKLTPMLDGQSPALEDVAAELGMAPWTLQRQLNAQGSRFKDLLDETRRDLATDYVLETQLNFAEIAWLLGFSGPPAFHKAYRRWFGMSPGEHRTTKTRG